MLIGTAAPSQFLSHAATLASFATPPEAFPDAVVFQAMFEIAVSGRELSLPPSLHPTNPPTLVVQAWHCPVSPWGAFAVAQARVGCRSGLRPRGMVQGCVVDNASAAAALRDRWGFPARVGEVQLALSYHGTQLRVAVDGVDACAIDALDPVPLGPDDVSFPTSVAMAHTTRGVRLVQIDTDLDVGRAERLIPQLVAFDAEAFGAHPTVDPQDAVSASVSRGTLHLAALRYVCKPDELAFSGTESVESNSAAI